MADTLGSDWTAKFHKFLDDIEAYADGLTRLDRDDKPYQAFVNHIDAVRKGDRGDHFGQVQYGICAGILSETRGLSREQKRQRGHLQTRYKILMAGRQSEGFKGYETPASLMLGPAWRRKAAGE